MFDQEKVIALLNAIRSRDRELGAELEANVDSRSASVNTSRLIRESAPERSEPRPRLTPETIVLRSGRPVLTVSNDEPTLTFEDAESEVWRDRLTKARTGLIPAIRAVGRVDLKNNPRFDWVGTGWLVAPDVIVTNRHVALEFGKRSSDAFVFRRGLGTHPMSASIDFVAEFGRDAAAPPASVTKILHIEEEDGPDLAFLQLQGDSLADPIPLSTQIANANEFIAVIGYPARDSRIPDQQLMENLFGNLYDKKRLAPGQIVTSRGDELEHDCSTLGGNSGSVLIGLEAGRAVGIHFAGRFLEANFAVPAHTIAEHLDETLRGSERRRAVSLSPHGTSPIRTQSSPKVSTTLNGSSVTLTIPLIVTVTVGIPAQTSPSSATSDQDLDVPVTEGVVEDYRDRQGYKEDFLGAKHLVRLPRVLRNSADVLEFEAEGTKDHVLRYQHFSVVMHRKRRMCFLSAVNIDGGHSRKSQRTTWRTDPRIPKDLQIMYECYGNPPKFSRGHMTRREDPVWGTAKEAELGNSDSMHVTNVTPQMQSFNSPIWLGLEDYALQNARQDGSKISVITGPVFSNNDPIRYGVKIPLAFWKVIAFLHDRTGKLSATGYSISQGDQIPEVEFVYGAYETFQRPISWIEEAAGVSFEGLAEIDPLTRADEMLSAPLLGWDQIRFTS